MMGIERRHSITTMESPFSKVQWTYENTEARGWGLEWTGSAATGPFEERIPMGRAWRWSAMRDQVENIDITDI